MPEVILAGVNGQPAIDAETGMPLTMEELLRRRGILAHKGVVSPLNMMPNGVSGASAAEQALADASRATANNSSGSAAAIGASPNTLDSAGVPIEATPATPKSLAADSTDDNDLWPWLVAGGGAAAAALYGARKLRGRPSAAAAAETVYGERVRTNPNLFREPNIEDADFTDIPNERIGSNRKLDALIDPKNVAQAGEVGAGPKALSGTAPVTDYSNSSVRNEIARRNMPRAELEDLNTRAPVSTRMQNAARQANQSRVQPAGTNPILLQDAYSDLSDSEMAVARQLASRIRTDRVSGAAARSRGVRTAGRGAGLPAPAPVYDQGSELAEAVAMVRRLRNVGTNTQKLLPLVRRLR